MSFDPTFPISIKFDDGEIETYHSVAELEQELEVFDSDKATDCEVRDALGRHVRLKVSERLVLEELSVVADL